MAKGERHELPLALKQDASLPAMEIKVAPKNGMDHIKAGIIPDHTEHHTAPALEDKVNSEQGEDSAVS
jgi:hypothetical protein